MNRGHLPQPQPRFAPRRPPWPGAQALCLLAGLALTPPGMAQATDPAVAGGPLNVRLKASPGLAPPSIARAARPSTPVPEPVLTLGTGDAVQVRVYGRPEMDTTTYVEEDGTIEVPLVGSVRVAGMSPAAAGRRVAEALRLGEYMVKPHVTITLAQFRSQQVSVLGEVEGAGRFPIEARTSVLDLIAQAGGTKPDAADVIFVLRRDAQGGTQRLPVDLHALRDIGNGASSDVPTLMLRGGDTVFVPRADQFYIHGEVQQPSVYRLEPGMTVLQAIARGGGVTPRGSSSRIEISRRAESGEMKTISADPEDPVRPDDVIRVKERFF